MTGQAEGQRPRNSHAVPVTLVLAVVLLLCLPFASARDSFITRPASVGPAMTVSSTKFTACGDGGYNPYYLAYDPVNGYVYVPNLNGYSNISVVKGCSVLITIPLPSGAHAAAAAFDPVNNYVYVTDEGLSHVYVLSGTTIRATITSSKLSCPLGVGYDPANDLMAVANSCASSLAFINGTKVVFTAYAGPYPFQIGYDPYENRLLATNPLTDNVTSLSAKDPAKTSLDLTIPAGSYPSGVAYDPVNHLDYVDNFLGDNITVFCGTCVGGHHSVTVSYGTGDVVWDQTKLAIYTDNESGGVFSIKGFSLTQTLRGPSTSTLVGITYDSATGDLYIAVFDSGNCGCTPNVYELG